MKWAAFGFGLALLGCGESPKPQTTRPESPNPTGYRADPDMQALSGEWRVTAITAGGNQVDAEEVAKRKLSYRFAGTSMMVSRSGRSMQPWSYSLDSRSTPKRIATKSLTDGSTVNGLYQIEGDKLRLCLNVGGGPAPAKLESTTDPKTDLLILEKMN